MPSQATAGPRRHATSALMENSIRVPSTRYPRVHGFLQIGSLRRLPGGQDLSRRSSGVTRGGCPYIQEEAHVNPPRKRESLKQEIPHTMSNMRHCLAHDSVGPVAIMCFMACTSDSYLPLRTAICSRRSHRGSRSISASARLGKCPAYSAGKFTDSLPIRKTLRGEAWE